MMPSNILGISTIFVILLDVLLVFKVTMASYTAVFAKRTYPYKFDKTKIPNFLIFTALATVALFGYGFFIAKDFRDALGFCLINAGILSVGIFIAITYQKKSK